MTEAFDPYVQWLGIEGGRRPGNHYELLGINLDENDPAEVARAADTLTARIRSVRPGPHVAEWQRLLDAVAEAKTCLMDPTAKAAYDRSLRGHAAAPGPAAPPSQGMGQAAPVAGRPPGSSGSPPPPAAAYGTPVSGPYASSPVPPQGSPVPIGAATPSPAPPRFADDTPAGSFPAPAPATRRTSKAKPSAAQMAVYGLTLAFLVMAAAFAYLLYQRRPGAATAQRAMSKADPNSALAPQRPAQRPGLTTPSQTGGAPSPENPRGSSRQRAPSSKQAPPPIEGPKLGGNPKTPAEPKAQEPPRGQEETGRAVQQPPGQQAAPKQSATRVPPVDGARQKAFGEAVADLRFAMSEHDVAGAQKHLQAAAANAQTPQERAEIDRLDTLLGHLEEFWKGMSRIVAGLESAEVLPVGDTFVAIVEVRPEQLTIKVEGQLRTYQIDRMPSRLVQALASAGFADDPATKVLVGTYFLVDPDGDSARTRQLWQEAARGGIDVRDLVPELDRWTAASAASGSPAPHRTAAPPNPQRLQQALQAVREKFQAEYGQATGVAGKARLAKLLLEAGGATDDDSDLRFVLLGEARDLAIAAGDSKLAFQAIDQIAGFYRVDALTMKTAALIGVVENARGSSAHRSIAQNALQLTEQAVQARRLDDAKKVAEVALSAARKSNNRPLMQQAVLVNQQVEALQKQADPRGATRQPVPPQP